MQQLLVERNFDTIAQLGFKNLVVAGCSFTTTHRGPNVPTSWPYYLRDLSKFDRVFSCAIPGGGNYFISQSLVWGLENQQLKPDQTLVVVMWSGNDREDEIFSEDAIDLDANFVYYFTDNVCHGMAGSPHRNSDPNTKWYGHRDIYKFKNKQSRAVENAIWTISLKGYLNDAGYQSIFVKFLDPAVPNITANFDIVDFLPPTIKTKYNSVMDPIQDMYSFCLKKMLLGEDNFHPSPDGHLAWTRERLLPYCQNRFSKQ